MAVTPDFVGQIYKDTNTGNLWRANSTTPGDWTLELQNMQVKWEPKTLKFGETIGLFTFGDLPGVTKIVFEQATILTGIDLEFIADLTEINFPNLVSIDPLVENSGYVNLQNLTGLTSVDLSNLTTVGYYLFINGCSALTALDISSLATVGDELSISGSKLTSIDLSSLTSVGNNLTLSNNTDVLSIDLSSLVTASENIIASGNTSCTSVDLTSFVPTNGKNVNFVNCALSTSSVDHVLARCVANAGYVSGSINLAGGTNSSPTSVGVGSDYETLILRGVIVSVNP